LPGKSAWSGADGVITSVPCCYFTLLDKENVPNVIQAIEKIVEKMNAPKKDVSGADALEEKTLA
jgi:hypothetical protein